MVVWWRDASLTRIVVYAASHLLHPECNMNVVGTIASGVAETLPVSQADELEELSPENRWLIETLWARAGVGILGGAPKTCKSWLGLEMAVSVASGSPCLGELVVHHSGPALIFMAEDTLEDVKRRLAGICRHRGVELSKIPLHVITAPTLRLDVERDQELLAETVRQFKPRFLLLDPFVRLHRIDENNAGSVSPLLGYLRALQREHATAIMVTHHSRKNSSKATHAGQGLRGSGDLHAWGDSNLYLRRSKKTLRLAIEHRAAPEPDPLTLALVGDPDTHLEITGRDVDDEDGDDAGRSSIEESVLAMLQKGPQTSRALRAAIGVRHASVQETTAKLEGAGLVRRDAGKWVVATQS